jgi:hypothetical protein
MVAMRTRTNGRTVLLAGRMASKGNASSRAKSFTSGLLFGLSSASLFLSGDLPRPKAPKEGIGSDWRAIGKDIGNALRKHGR